MKRLRPQKGKTTLGGFCRAQTSCAKQKFKSISKLLPSLAICCKLAVYMLLFMACEDKMDKHYEVPGWLKGSTWEVLQARGNYSIFLEGADKAGFRPVLEGKALATVMAPSDEAFTKYLASIGKASIGDLAEEELQKLIGFHIMYYSYSTDMLVNFRPREGDGATDDEKKVNAGMYYKHRTRSKDAPTTADNEGTEVTVYHTERLLPVFSHLMFQTKKIDAKSNYEYFYPGSEWTGGNGFNVSNASVEEYGIIADNGYVYLVDQVVEPLETIYNEMAMRSDYSTYLELYDQYGYYQLDPDLTADFGGGTDLYRFYHQYPLADIACEWPYSDYTFISYMSSMAYSIFAPSNSAFESFFNSYWSPGGYSSLSDVNILAIGYLLRNTVYASSIVFPEEIKNGSILNSSDTQISFDVDAVPQANRAICVNGAFYGQNLLEPPGMFLSVTGPAFKYKDLSWYLNMLASSNMLLGLSSSEAMFTKLIPSNSQMEACEISLVEDMLYSNEGGEPAAMSSSAMTNIVNLHTVTGGAGIGSSGTQVLRTNSAFKYWYVKDGKLTTSVLFSTLFDNPAATEEFFDLTEVAYNGGAWSNGKAYTYNSSEMFSPTGPTTSVQYRIAVTRDASYSFYEFSELLRKADMVDASTGTITFLNRSRCLIFIPTNAAIQAAIAAGRIPGVATDGTVTDQNALVIYLRRYFVLTDNNGITVYPYPGSGVNGAYDLTVYYTSNGERVFTKLVIEDTGSALRVQHYHPGTGYGSKVDVIPDYHYFPFAFDDGGVHFINDIL